MHDVTADARLEPVRGHERRRGEFGDGPLEFDEDDASCGLLPAHVRLDGVVVMFAPEATAEATSAGNQTVRPCTDRAVETCESATGVTRSTVVIANPITSAMRPPAR